MWNLNSAQGKARGFELPIDCGSSALEVENYGKIVSQSLLPILMWVFPCLPDV